MSPLQRAISFCGSQAELARRIGGTIKQPHVWGWLHRGARQVPAEHCAAIERATAGAVSRYELRPDVFGPAPEQEAA